MEFIETSFYTKYITSLLSDDEYKNLQNFLVEHPQSGKVIKGSGGLRKLRWDSKNKGKSSGIRNIYYYYENEHTIYMIYVYEKSKKDDLSKKELDLLKQIIQKDQIMEKEMFEELLSSVKEAKDIMQGKKEPSRRFYIDEPNAKEIRQKLHLTQNQFASLMNISIHTLRNWEQGRRQPEGPAKVLLNVANNHPNILIEMIN